MIILEPSYGITTDTKLNFNIIGNLLTTLLEFNHKRKINLYVKIHKSRNIGTSFCTHIDKKEYLINLDTSNTSRKYIFSSILHEIRHCIQKEVFKYWNATSYMKTWKDYWCSKEEVDARKMEALTSDFIKSYDAFLSMYGKFKTKKLYTIEK